VTCALCNLPNVSYGILAETIHSIHDEISLIEELTIQMQVLLEQLGVFHLYQVISILLSIKMLQNPLTVQIVSL